MFDVKSGVKQVDPLPPLIFSPVINNSVRNINNGYFRMKTGIYNVSTLLYADDIMLI